MTLDQLRIFLAVAERDHVTRAAEALNLTQSTVSGAIHALEIRHDVKLFHRVGRRIELTEAGKAMAEEAKAIHARVRVAETAMADLSGIRRGTVQSSQARPSRATGCHACSCNSIATIRRST